MRSATGAILSIALLLLGPLAVAPAPAHAQSGAAPLPAGQVPLPPEKNPPGDIPDTQVFVLYHSPLGFSLKVPEGWARRDKTNGASFTDRYDGLTIRATQAPDATAARRAQIAALKQAPGAVRISKITSVRLPAGAATMIAYSSNSAPNPVTNKAIRLENARYLFWKNGQLVTLTLYAPYGADNADQWRLMSRSFRWK